MDARPKDRIHLMLLKGNPRSIKRHKEPWKNLIREQPVEQRYYNSGAQNKEEIDDIVTWTDDQMRVKMFIINFIFFL